MNRIGQFFEKYAELSRTLSPKDFLSLLLATAVRFPKIVERKNLRPVDRAMSRDIQVRFGPSRLAIPVRQIDQMLSSRNDSPTFGTVRELYARNCYLKHLELTPPIRAVLDLGANRGMFSLLALVDLRAEIVVGVEPADYDAVYQLLLDWNQCSTRPAPRYRKFIASESTERAAPDKFVSIPTILREQSIERFDLVKIDIEGGEKDLFAEPGWLTAVDHLTMELHPTLVGDLSLIPAALQHYGFDYQLMGRHGELATIDAAMFAVASRRKAQ